MYKSIWKRVLAFCIGISMIAAFFVGLYFVIAEIVGQKDATEVYIFTFGTFSFIMLAAYLIAYSIVKQPVEYVYENDWILCSEDMPTENGQYLCVDSKGKQYVCDYGYSHDKEKMAFFHARAVVDVVAWQYLPELPASLAKI